MKKIIRNVWICALSGLAFLTACGGPKGMSRQERRQLVKERDIIRNELKERESATVYGSPEILEKYALEGYKLLSRLDTINYKLGQDVDLEKSAARVRMQERLMELRAMLRQREGARVYGSPEVINQHKKEINGIKTEIEELTKKIQAQGN